VRTERVERSPQGWQPCILPLNYARLTETDKLLLLSLPKQGRLHTQVALPRARMAATSFASAPFQTGRSTGQRSRNLWGKSPALCLLSYRSVVEGGGSAPPSPVFHTGAKLPQLPFRFYLDTDFLLTGRPTGIRTRINRLKAGCSSLLSYRSELCPKLVYKLRTKLAGEAGFEPATVRVTTVCSATELHAIELQGGGPCWT
jgi:hypothetical protein